MDILPAPSRFLNGRAARAVRSAAAIILVAVCGVLATPAPLQSRAAPCLSVAFSPDGSQLAVGGYRDVRLLESASGKTAARLPGHSGNVTGVAFSPDGKTLAACGGLPGASGEIRLWNVTTRKARVLTALHKDVVYSIAWSPDGKTLAAGSYDRMVSLWNVATGEGRLLKDHTDSVYSVAFSPDGTRLASASADRTVKLWDLVSGKRLFTLGDSTAELYGVAFNPRGGEVAAVGVDRMLRKWSLTPTAGTLSRSAFAHEGPILRVLNTPDGSGVYTSSEDRSIKLWDTQTLQERRVLDRQPDWALGLALTADGKRLAVCRYDGSTAIYDTAVGTDAAAGATR